MAKIDYRSIYEKNKHDWYAMTEEPQKYEALLAGHYSDCNHFVYELLQNAEDERATKVVIEYRKDYLAFYHDGDPFDEADVRGVSSMLMGTKNRDSAQTIGRFGMGFKSVFKYTSEPEIYSDDDAFCIKNFLLPEAIDDTIWDSAKMKQSLSFPDGENAKYIPFSSSEHLTCIAIPFEKKNDRGEKVAVDGSDVLQKLNALNGEILLFLSHIKDLYWIDDESGVHEHITTDYVPGDEHMVTCRIYGTNENWHEVITRYLKYKDTFDLPDMKDAEVSVAYRLADSGRTIAAIPRKESPIYVYFPTREENDLPFLIHGSFETAVSREKLMTPSAFNNLLFDRLADLIAQSMGDLAARKLISQNFFREILIPAFKDEEENETVRGLKDKVSYVFRAWEILPDINGNYRRASELVIPVPYGIADMRHLTILKKSFDGVKDFVNINTERGNYFTEYFTWLRDDLRLSVYELSDWAKSLKCLPDTILMNADQFEELKKFYDFLSGYIPAYYYNERSYSRGGAYENTVRNSVEEIWDDLKQAPIVLNEENRLVCAYDGDKPQVYLSASSSYRQMLNSSIVSRLVTKDYNRLFSEGLDIADFDNYQYIKEKVLEKYSGTDDQVHFDDDSNEDKEYIEDLKQIMVLMDSMADPSSLVDLMADMYIIRVKSGDEEMYSQPSQAFVNTSVEGVNLRVYFDGIDDKYPIDYEFYNSNNIDIEKLVPFGITRSIVHEGSKSNSGSGENYWVALGEYCPNLTIDGLQSNLSYIQDNPGSELSRQKSALILSLLLSLKDKLHGVLRKRRSQQHDDEDDSVALKTTYDYEWVYDKSWHVRYTRDISRFELNGNVYKELPDDKDGFRILGFVEKDEDIKAETFDRVKELNTYDKRLIFRQLADDLGYDIDRLEDKEQNDEVFYPGVDDEDDPDDTFNPDGWVSDEFPRRRVINFDALTQHVRQQFFFADPVKYQKVMRQIRVSKSADEARAYTKGMYMNGDGINICQICRKPSRNVEAIEISNFGIELPQLNLSLCPDCARKYKNLRDVHKGEFRQDIAEAIRNLDINGDQEDYEIEIAPETTLHFTQTHIAEVKTILSLLDEYGVPGFINSHEAETVILNEDYGIDNTHEDIDPLVKETGIDGLSIGSVVRSTRFGDGRIIGFDDISMQIKVSFTKYGVKTFTVPMAFTNGYLKLV